MSTWTCDIARYPKIMNRYSGTKVSLPDTSTCPVSEIIPLEYWLTVLGYRTVSSISSATIG